MSGYVFGTPEYIPEVIPFEALTTALELTVLSAVVGVGKLVDAQMDAARKKAETERQAALQWEACQQTQQNKMEALRAMQTVLEQTEKEIAGLQMGSVGNREAAASSAEGYLDLGRGQAEPEEVAAAVQTIATVLDSVPPDLIAEAAIVVPRLARQRDQILARRQAGGKVTWEEAENFRTLVQNTLNHARETHTAHVRTQAEALARLEVIVREAFELRELARGAHRESLDSICGQLSVLCNSDDLKLGQLDLVEKHLLTLKTEVTNTMLKQAYRTSLGQSIERHLQDMGYEKLVGFPDDMPTEMATTSLRIPGGDVVRLAIHPNAQMAGELVHESLSGKTELTSEDLQFVREQEKRWCTDFKELVRRLIADGFQYKVTFEQEIPAFSVKVVVVESGAELARKLAEDEEEEQRLYGDADDTRYLT